MSNPLTSLFGQPRPQNNPFGNVANMMQQFQQFKSSFKGDPQQIVQELRRSGRMSEEQFQQLSAMATQLQNGMR